MGSLTSYGRSWPPRQGQFLPPGEQPGSHAISTRRPFCSWSVVVRVCSRAGRMPCAVQRAVFTIAARPPFAGPRPYSIGRMPRARVAVDIHGSFESIHILESFHATSCRSVYLRTQDSPAKECNDRNGVVLPQVRKVVDSFDPRQAPAFARLATSAAKVFRCDGFLGADLCSERANGLYVEKVLRYARFLRVPGCSCAADHPGFAGGEMLGRLTTNNALWSLSPPAPAGGHSAAGATSSSCGAAQGTTSSAGRRNPLPKCRSPPASSTQSSPNHRLSPAARAGQDHPGRRCSAGPSRQ